MMSFCRKSVHSFLAFADTLSPFKSHPDDDDDINFSVSPPPSPPRRDPGGVGFVDHNDGGVDGFMYCTESLGFESSDQRLLSEDEMITEDNGGGEGGGGVRGRRRVVVERSFPPLLSSLNQHGHPNFYLRPVRKDGRLELTEVRIERPEILRASRGDGRLRLHLIMDKEQEDEDEEEDIMDEEEEEVEGFVEEGTAGFRRCVEAVDDRRRRRQRRHQHLDDVWRHHCLTTS